MNSTSPTFTKMSGAGNLFVLIDLRDATQISNWQSHRAGQITRPELAKKICQNPEGMGADGLVVVEASTGPEDFTWDFYNADGSSAEMCGNAARCVTRFVFTQGQIAQKMTFKTLAGVIAGEIKSANIVAVTMPPISAEAWDQNLVIDEQATQFDLINSGVPHAVISNENVILTEEVRYFSSLMRNHQSLQPQGANVTYYKAQGPDLIQAVTYERGVENFTKACGTGAVAAAWSFKHRHPNLRLVKVSMPGGLLEVSFADSRPQLIGPADFLGQFQLSDEFFDPR